MAKRKEWIFLTLGRLSGAIKNGNETRALDLLEKISKEVSDMDVKIMRCQRDHAKFDKEVMT